MKIELGRIYTTKGWSIVLPARVVAAGRLEALVLYTTGASSSYRSVYADYDTNTGKYIGTLRHMDMADPILDLDIAEAVLTSVVYKGWDQSCNDSYFEDRLQAFLKLFREVY